MAVLPFRLEARKPALPLPYRINSRELSDQLHRRRLDLGLTQAQVAKQMGVCIQSERAWEIGKSEPSLPMLPRIFGFLGCQPRAMSDSLPDRLSAFRMTKGLSHRTIGRLLGVHQWKVWSVEAGAAADQELRQSIEALLSACD